MGFTRASKKQARLRMALDGPSGAGKTFTALTFAFALAGPTGRVAVIDTERGSASKYADRFPPYDVLELARFSPQLYTEAIEEAAAARYDVLVIDSLSHAWEGEGGALDMVDKAASRQKDNSYTAWKDVTPVHRHMVDAILQCSCHVIVTMRSKMEYVLEPGKNGKLEPHKVGMAPIQRQGTEYEFDIVCDLDIHHKLIVSKTRCPAVDEADELKPTASWMRPVIAWLSGDATPAAVAQPPVAATPVASAHPGSATEVVATVPDSDRQFGQLGSAPLSIHQPAGPADGDDYLTAPRPWTPQQIIAALHAAAARVKPADVANGAWGAAIGLMDEIGTQERHALLKAAWGVESSKDATEPQKIATARYVKPVKDAPTTDNPNPHWRSDNPHLAAEMEALGAWYAFES